MRRSATERALGPRIAVLAIILTVLPWLCVGPAGMATVPVRAVQQPGAATLEYGAGRDRAEEPAFMIAACAGADPDRIDDLTCPGGAPKTESDGSGRSVRPGAEALATSYLAPSCFGDGTSGKRVQLIYARPTGAASTLAVNKPRFVEIAARIDDIFYKSSAGTRRVRFVSDPASGCVPTIIEVVVPGDALTDFFKAREAIRALAYTSNDRKYLVFADDQDLVDPSYYGRSDKPVDQRKTRQNSANGYGFVLINEQTWSSSNDLILTRPAHELVHALGGVFYDRSSRSLPPNGNSENHCTDLFDVMCPGQIGVPGKVRCAGDYRAYTDLDCRDDDYFNPKPAPGSYLSRFWNVADSEYLARPTTPAARTAGDSQCGPGPGPAIGRELDVRSGDGYPIDIEVTSPGGRFQEYESRLWVDGAEIPLNYRDHLVTKKGGRVRYAPPILLGLLPDERVEHTVILVVDAGACWPPIRTWTFKAPERVSIDYSPRGVVQSADARPRFTLDIPGSSIYPLYPALYLDGKPVYHPDPGQTANPWSVRRIGDRWVWTPSSDLSPGKHLLLVDWFIFSGFSDTPGAGDLRDQYFLPPTIGFFPALRDSLPPWEFELVIGPGTQ